MNDNNRKRLLVLTSTFPRWKGDHEPPFVYELARRLTPEWEVHVLAPHTAGSAPVETIDGINVHRFRYGPDWLEKLAYEGGMLARLKQNPWRYFILPLFFIAQYLNSRRIVRHYAIDVIHAHWLVPQGVTALLTKRTTGGSIPVLCTSHGADLFALQGGVVHWVKRMVLKHTDFLTVVSDAMRREAERLGADPDRSEVIPMGVDLESRFIPAAERRDPKTLVFAGRLVEKKGLCYLLEAFSELLREQGDLRLLVVGTGPEEESLRKQASTLGIGRNVEFIGAVENSDLPSLYQQAAIAVFPFIMTPEGDQEGFGLVIVEALGCGCAVVVSDLPAVRGILSDGVNGLLVPQKERDRLREAIEKLYRDQELCSRLARQGGNEVREKFDWKIVAGRYNKLLCGLADAGPKKTGE